ncbi:MAG: hypothetical protein JXA06_04545 [Bacteroidetes bacterium]|nr:hypothetical protein [Bacteroidota bacterium]
MKYLIYFAVFLITLLHGHLYAQEQRVFQVPNQHIKIIDLSKKDTLYQLPHEFVAGGSEKITIDSAVYPKKDYDYEMDYRSGQVILFREFMDSLFLDSLTHRMSITYRTLPLDFKQEYTLHRIEIRRDSIGKEKKIIAPASAKLFSNDFFGPGLQKSGSIVRGFSIGSNRDLSLSSGFRMQLAGKLAQDVDVTAALTDENSPIQPEGTTKTLQEVDKVYIEIKYPRYSAILGDFNILIDQKEGGEFGRLNRKLQGARGMASFENIGGSDLDAAFSVIGATARGKYASNYFQGQEGMQGPYRLTGNNGENRLIIIAGSERVFLDGELLTRGEVNDYIIDYSTGEITFSSKRLITTASRITVDFEYSDRQFIRNLVGGSVSTSAFGKKLNLNVAFTQEADDPDSPVDFALNDSTRAVLRRSGADRMKASVSGLVKVDTGSGQYALHDTIIAGKQYSILVYSPGDPSALYLVSFSPVDYVPPDSAGYTRIAAGQFRFAGIGQGNYMPLKFLPMPQRHQVLDINGRAAITSDLSVAGEYAFSNFNRNRFSDHDSSSLRGGALTFSARYNPKQLNIDNTNFGELDIGFSERFIDRYFFTLDRLNDVEFDRKWDITETGETDEEIREFSFAYKPVQSIKGAVKYGILDRPGEIKSKRMQVDIEIADSSLPKIEYRIEDINTDNAYSNNESRWIRQRGTALYEISGWQPAFRFETEARKEKPPGYDSLNQGSFRYLEIAPSLRTAEFSRMSLSAEMRFRTEDSAYIGYLRRASQSVTQLYTWQIGYTQLITSLLSLSIRNVKYTEEFKQRGNLNSDAVLVRSQTRFTPFKRGVETDLYYEFSNQRSAQMERIFIRVTPGSGNYRYLGDKNGNGIADENDFELTRFDGDYIVVYLPSDQLYPAADLKASVRVRLHFAHLLPVSSEWLNKALRALSAETYLRVDEKNKETDTKQIYLLNFSHFLNRNTTVAGSQQITQDVFIFENNPDLSFRFRYSELFGMTQYISGIEESYKKERSVRIRSQFVKEIGNQTEFVNKTDQVKAAPASARERNIISNAVKSDFSYRPVSNWEIGFNIAITGISNDFGGKEGKADINEEGFRIVRSFPGDGQVQAEIRREEVVLTGIKDPNEILPYEFTEGKTVGQSYLWQLVFDYRVTGNLQLSINYYGRSEWKRQPLHYLRMEAKAFF